MSLFEVPIASDRRLCLRGGYTTKHRDQLAEYHKGRRGLSITTAGRLHLAENEAELKSAIYTQV